MDDAKASTYCNYLTGFPYVHHNSKLFFVIGITLLLITVFPNHLTANTYTACNIAPLGNSDTQLNLADLIILRNIILGQRSASPKELILCDVAPLGSPNGQLDTGDLVVIQRAVLGEITLPPIIYEPLSAIIPTNINIGDIVNGEVIISGAAGTIPLNNNIIITNLRTLDTTIFTSNADGSFTASIMAETGDKISITISDVFGDFSEPTIMGAGNELGISITNPHSGDTIDSDIVLVSGLYKGPANTGITINGVIAQTTSEQFYASIPLNSGVNNITITITTPDNLSFTHSINVISSNSMVFKSIPTHKVVSHPLVSSLKSEITRVISCN